MLTLSLPLFACLLPCFFLAFLQQGWGRRWRCCGVSAGGGDGMLLGHKYSGRAGPLRCRWVVRSRHPRKRYFCRFIDYSMPSFRYTPLIATSWPRLTFFFAFRDETCRRVNKRLVIRRTAAALAAAAAAAATTVEKEQYGACRVCFQYS